MDLRRHTLLIFVLCWAQFPPALGGAVTNFTECVDEGNHVLLDMPVRCIDAKTLRVYLGDVKQVYGRPNIFQTVAEREAARIALEPKTTTQAQVSQAPNGHGNSNLKCRTGYSTKWHTEYKNQGTTRYPGVMCQNNRRHHLGHCISFCQQCTRRLGRHVAGFNFGPGCRCYSASQVRQVQLTGTGWDFCTRSKGNKAVSKSPQAPRAGNSNQAKIKHPLSPNATASKKDTKAFHTSNCPVKTLYARTCWAESARKHCTKFPPQMAYDLVMKALPNQEKMYQRYLSCLPNNSTSTRFRRTGVQ